MRFEVIHRTLYTYEQPVGLGSHIIRLRPRCNGTQRLLEHRLEILPEPGRLTECLDHEGNVIACVRFPPNLQTERLEITAYTRVETLRPADFAPEPWFYGLPARYPPPMESALTACLQPVPGTVGNRFRAFLGPLVDASGAMPLAFLDALNTALHTGFTREIRERGGPQAPEVTLARRQGACRDLAVLFIAACRAVGLAARFVSGYQKGDGHRAQRYLHAWPEVYIPGGGWRGYDPTHGVAVSDTHVPVAASAWPEGAAPIEGSYFGAASSRMEVDLSIKSADAEKAS